MTSPVRTQVLGSESGMTVTSGKASPEVVEEVETETESEVAAAEDDENVFVLVENKLLA